MPRGRGRERERERARGRGIKRPPRYLRYGEPARYEGGLLVVPPPTEPQAWYVKTPKAALFDVAYSFALRLTGEENHKEAEALLYEEAALLGWGRRASAKESEE